MNVQDVTTHNTALPNRDRQMSFKSCSGLFNASGAVMQSIENGGFLASFLIQDGIGMTAPRTVAGFLRDKEETGNYNLQEGFEVLGREGLTGPCMMAVAPLALLIAAKFGRSTSVNTQLIKRFGNSLKELISKPDFDKKILSNNEEFRNAFYRDNVSKILKNTLGKEHATEENINYVLEQLKNRNNIPKNVNTSRFRGKVKYKNECMDNIVKFIDDIRYKSSSDLDLLQKSKFGSKDLNDIKAFGTKDLFEALEKYASDVISANENLDKLDAITAESLKHKALGKRIITNVSMIAATLGVLSVLPKIYARSNVAPGARMKQELKEADDNENNIVFKGKKNPVESLGRLIDKNKSDFISSELEYNGHNFTNTLMAGLSIFGLLFPRGARAYNRAEVDENGKKDLTELYEILLRDVTSSLAVVFAVPMLTRAFVTTYEKHLGFVLMHKNRDKNGLKTFLDLFNPYTKAHVLTNKEINALYSNVDSKAKMLNFCDFINKNGGDLQKILSKSETRDKVFNKSTFELSSIKNMKKEDKNKKIIEFFKTFEHSDEVIKELMNGTKKAKGNKIAAFARGLNSAPALLTTFLISPYLLGWCIPRLTYKNTRRIHEKQDKERENKNQMKINA